MHKAHFYIHMHKYYDIYKYVRKGIAGPLEVRLGVQRIKSSFWVLANIRIFLFTSVIKRKKNGASLPGRKIFTGYSWKSQEYSSLNPASAVFLLFSGFLSFFLRNPCLVILTPDYFLWENSLTTEIQMFVVILSDFIGVTWGGIFLD